MTCLFCKKKCNKDEMYQFLSWDAKIENTKWVKTCMVCGHKLLRIFNIQRVSALQNARRSLYDASTKINKTINDLKSNYWWKAQGIRGIKKK